jgi:hypothetical protein
VDEVNLQYCLARRSVVLLVGGVLRYPNVAWDRLIQKIAVRLIPMGCFQDKTKD